MAAIKRRRKWEHVHLALLFMIPSPRSTLAFLAMIRAQLITPSHKKKVLAFEQYLTVLQEVHTKSSIGALNGSFEPTQAKQLSHVSTADLLQQK